MEGLSERVVNAKGGNWNRGVYAGPRAVNTNNQPWNVNTNIGSRLACDTFVTAITKEAFIITVISAVAFCKKKRQISHPLRKEKVWCRYTCGCAGVFIIYGGRIVNRRLF